MTVFKTITLKGFGEKLQGKVRDFYIVGDRRIIVTTDRISAFDVILGYIPYKGQVLNLLSKFWFEKTKDIIENHMLVVPDPNVLIAKNCELIPIEMIVRGYMTGSTVTSIWTSYKNGDQVIYGVKFPDGLKKNDKLPTPVITPTYHGDMTGKGGHDTRLTKKDIIGKKLIGKKIYEQMEQTALALFARGTKICDKAGIILVDTKYEFGLYNGKLVLVDEIHTPDSSRFWIKKTYKERIKNGLEPENYDKEFMRLWYSKRGYTGDGEPPPMPESLARQVSKRYRDIYEKITGDHFVAKRNDDPEKRIKEALKTIQI